METQSTNTPVISTRGQRRREDRAEKKLEYPPVLNPSEGPNRHKRRTQTAIARLKPRPKGESIDHKVARAEEAVEAREAKKAARAAKKAALPPAPKTKKQVAAERAHAKKVEEKKKRNAKHLAKHR